MSSGWISLHRKFLDSDLWCDEKFTRGQAWVDLILLSNHKDGYFRCRGVRIDVKRGQCGHGSVALSKRWKWSRGKVIRFLKELENDGNIVQQKTNVTTLITITKYDEYQTKQDSKRTANGQQTDINNKDNNYNKERSKDIGAKKQKKLFLAPDINQVNEYLNEKLSSHIDGQQFIDHHQARGWIMSNRQKMKDWKAALRTWIKNDRKFNSGRDYEKRDTRNRAERSFDAICNLPDN